MKIEELETIVKTNMQQTIKAAQNCINRLDFNIISRKAEQVIQKMKNSINSLNKKNQIAITINNTQSQKQISQFQKEIDSLQKKIQARKIMLNINTNSSQTRLTSIFTLFKEKISQSIGNISNMKNVFSKIPAITKNITKNVKAIGSGIKKGVSNILKFARKSFFIATNIFYSKWCCK